MNMDKIKIRLLILPKFEVGEMTGDAPGEAQYYYETYFDGSKKYDIKGGFEQNSLYVKDSLALYVAGMGKVNSAISLMAVLADSRFDFSDAYFMSTGCCGAAYGAGVMGDVYLITACVDYDIGHRVDSTELSGDSFTTWIPDSSYSSSAYNILNLSLCDKIYALIKDIKPQTTPKTRAYMASAFENADWAVRDPRVLRATTLSGDNYWKGLRGHANGVLMAKTYNCPDPFYSSEMEDVALAVVLERMGKLDKFFAVRGAVNMDVFTHGTSPEALWSVDTQQTLTSENSVESADIFTTAMKNTFDVGKVIIDAVMSGEL